MNDARHNRHLDLDTYPIPQDPDLDIVTFCFGQVVRVLKERGWCQKASYAAPPNRGIDLSVALSMVAQHYWPAPAAQRQFSEMYLFRGEMESAVLWRFPGKIASSSLVEINDSICQSFADVCELLAVTREEYRATNGSYFQEWNAAQSQHKLYHRTGYL